jgi:hypothetical protein
MGTRHQPPVLPRWVFLCRPVQYCLNPRDINGNCPVQVGSSRPPWMSEVSGTLWGGMFGALVDL